MSLPQYLPLSFPTNATHPTMSNTQELTSLHCYSRPANTGGKHGQNMHQDKPNCCIIVNSKLTWIDMLLNAVNQCLLYIIPLQADSLSWMAPNEGQSDNYNSPSSGHFITCLLVMFIHEIHATLTLPTRSQAPKAAHS